MTRGLLSSFLVLSFSACVTTSGARSLSEAQSFPARGELEKLAARPATVDARRFDAAAVSRWTLAGPLATEAASVPVKPGDPWEVALAPQVESLGATLSADLRCVAREVARVVAAQGKAPQASLRSFIEDRCGTTASGLRLTWLTLSTEGVPSDDALRERLLPQLREQLAALKGSALVGVGFARSGDTAVALLAGGTPRVQLDAPVSLLPRGQPFVVVRGRALKGGYERVTGLINFGPTGVKPCDPMEGEQPPRFALRCPVNPADASQAIALAGFEPGRLLGESLAEFLVWPGGQASDEWKASGTSVLVEPGAFSRRFLEAVNRARGAAGLAALEEAAAQTAVATQVAPHYFEALYGGGAGETADRVALGLMAGWEVGVEVVSAAFGSELLAGSRDVTVYLDLALRGPFTRQALMNPKATHLASGAQEVEGALAAIFATYVRLPDFDRKAAEVELITRMNRIRLDSGLELAQWTLWPQDEGAVVEARLKDGSFTPQDALQHTLQRTADVSTGRVEGTVQLVDDLENFQFPPEVLLRRNINVFLTVGVTRRSDWAHARYVVCFVLAKQGDVPTARGPSGVRALLASAAQGLPTPK